MNISAKIQGVSAAVMLFAAVPLFAVTGTVISVSGKAEIQHNGAWVPLKEGDLIEAGAVISTGFKSEAVLRIGESVLTVKPLTRLTLEELMELDSVLTSAVYLDMGGLKADIKATENQRTGFTVKSPAVTASVRGTSGEVDADGTVKGYTGVWSVSDPAGKQRTSVLSGQTAAADPDGISAPQVQAVMQSMAVFAPEGIAAAESAGISAAAITTAAQPVRGSATRQPGRQSSGETSLDVTIELK